MKHNIRFAIVGCGHIGKRHAEMISGNSDCELAALCDIRDKEGCGVSGYDVPFFNSIEELLNEGPTIDVINICTPNGLHTQQTIKVLEHGCHVVCEKPISLKRSDAEQMIYKSLEVGKHIFAVMQNRYSPPSVWLKELIENKRLGKIFMVQINCYWNRDARYYTAGNWHGTQQMDGGTLFTQFSHFVDIMYWLFGDIKNIQANISDFNHQDLTDFEDTGAILFDFVNEGMGTFNFSTAIYDKNMESSMTVIGEKGSVKVAGQYMDKVEYCHIENYTLPKLAPSNPPNNYGLYKGSAQNHHLIIQNVVDKLKGNTPITTNALEGMKVVDIIERMYKAGGKE
ncbi:Gfo/Idh/MocA family oxidoreductase [Puteibacter caeruleilacunae]|nr:Gfo/Idh/MocA family oxidoreductase [Puteibacter caeruleilacunae]